MSVNMLVGDLVIVKAWSIDAEQAAVNRVWYSCTAITGTGGTDVLFATAMDTVQAPLYKSAMSPNASYRGIQVQVYRNQVPFASVFTIANTGAGTSGTITMPRQVSGIITCTTALAGKKYRGRLYFPFPSTVVDAGQGVPTAPYIAILQNVGNGFYSTQNIGGGGNTSTLIPVLVHKNPAIGPPLPPTPIIANTVPTKFATQRRRGAYGRANVSPI